MIECCLYYFNTRSCLFINDNLLFTWLRFVKTLASVWCIFSWPCLSSYNPCLSRIICYGIRKEQMTTVFKTSPCQTNDFEKLENSKKIQNCQFRLTVYGAVPTVFLNLKYYSVHIKICFIRIYTNVLPIVAGVAAYFSIDCRAAHPNIDSYLTEIISPRDSLVYLLYCIQY